MLYSLLAIIVCHGIVNIDIWEALYWSTGGVVDNTIFGARRTR